MTVNASPEPRSRRMVPVAFAAIACIATGLYIWHASTGAFMATEPSLDTTVDVLADQIIDVRWPSVTKGPLVFSQPGDGSDALAINRHDPETLALVDEQASPLSSIGAIGGLDPSGRVVALVGEREIVRFDVEAGTVVGRHIASTPMQAVWLPGETADGWLLGSMFDDGVPHLALWRAGDRDPRVRLALTDIPGGTFAWLGVQPGGGHIAVVYTRQLDASFTRFENTIFLIAVDGTDLRIDRTTKLPEGDVALTRPHEGWSPDGQRLVIPLRQGPETVLAALSLDDGDIERWPTKGLKDSVVSLVFGSNGRWIALATATHLHILDPADGRIVVSASSIFPAEDQRFVLDRQVDGHIITTLGSSGLTRTVEWSPDGNQLIVGNNGGMRVFDVAAPSGSTSR